MENTGKVHFEDDLPQWYIAMGDRWVGPLLAADVYEKVLRQEISWAHFVWKPGQSDWKRICDVNTFQTIVPSLPGKDLKKEVQEASKPVVRQAPRRSGTQTGAKLPPPPVEDEEKIWFLYFNDSQFGPFSHGEVERFLQVGKINRRVHTWRDGMESWKRLEGVSEFAKAVGDMPKEPPKGAAKITSEKTGPGGIERRKLPRIEHRGAPRRPLVAKIIVSNGESVIIGMCRDISIGGMQVLVERVPGKVGSKVRMNVSPSGTGVIAMDNKIEAFVAEGLIVRILDDGRGFSFRFDRMSPNAKKAIEKYISTTD